MKNSSLLSLLACPKCHGELTKDGEHALVCQSCRLAYPVEKGLPVLLIDKAIALDQPGSGSPA